VIPIENQGVFLIIMKHTSFSLQWRFSYLRHTSIKEENNELRYIITDKNQVRLLLVSVSVIAIILMFTSQSYAKIDPKNVMGMWLFNDGSGDKAQDSSGNKNDGILTGGPKWDKGKFGGALMFGGTSDYVLVKTPPNIPLADTPRTIAGWINDQGSNANWGSIICYGANDCNGLMFGIGKQGSLTFWGGCKDFQTGTALPQNEWAFVAITYDQKNITVWLNDKAIPIAMTAFNTPTSNLFMGAETINNGAGFRQYYKGLIDEFAIFDVALAPADLKTIMDQGLEKAAGGLAVSLSGKLTTTWGEVKDK
jgi:hypothetical protein